MQRHTRGLDRPDTHPRERANYPRTRSSNENRPRIASIPLFRLNGFLTIRTSLSTRDSQGDANRCRSFGRSLSASFRKCYKANDRRSTAHGLTHRPLIVIAEVKTGLCALNGPWTDRDRGNMQKVLRAIGILPTESIEEAAGLDYEQGYCEREQAYLTLCCLGRVESGGVRERYPLVPQLSWESVLRFIFRRLREYDWQKAWHESWDPRRILAFGHDGIQREK